MLFDSNASSVYTPGFAQNQGGTDRYLHTDWIGSTRYLSDSTGNNFPGMLRYDAFGGRSSTGGSDGYYPSASQFVGGLGYQTEYASAAEPGTGLQYLEQRYYDPSTGRFISQDPARFVGGLDLYEYCSGDPVNRADPSGLYSFAEWKRDFTTGLHVIGEFPGSAFNGVVNWLASGTTFRKDFKSLRDANCEAYPGLPEAGRQIYDFQQQFTKDVGNSVFWGVVGAKSLTDELAEEGGAYRTVKGHHIFAKSAFRGAVNYDANEGFSISQEFMESRNWSHGDMTGFQQRAFRELAASGRPNTLAEQARIAVGALQGGR